MSFLIKAVWIEGLGVFTEEQLVDGPREHLFDVRADLASTRRTGRASKCLACGQPVFLRFTSDKARKPHFAHRQGENVGCPWFKEGGRHPAAVSADIHGGVQTGKHHEELCAALLALATRDRRYIEGSGRLNCSERSEVTGERRRPDVRFDFDGNKRFAVEVQIAPIQVQHIVERSDFYRAENISLIWVGAFLPFDEADRTFRQDIASRAAGNHFIFDADAREASEAIGAIRLKALWTDEHGVKNSALVGLDDLRYTEESLPFYRDALTPAIFSQALKKRCMVEERLANVSPSDWHPGEPRLIEGVDFPNFESHRLMGVLLAIWRAAERPGERGTRIVLYKVDKIDQALDSYLNSQDGRQKAQLIHAFTTRTPVWPYLKESLQEKIKRVSAEAAEAQNYRSSPWWSFIQSLFPEVLDHRYRAIAKEAGTLPAWAYPSPSDFSSQDS